MYKTKSSSFIKHLDFMLIDLVCLELSFYLSFIYGISGLFKSSYYGGLVFVLMLVETFATVFLMSFKNVIKRGYYIEFLHTFRHDVLISLILMVYLYITSDSHSFSAINLACWHILYFFLSYITRVIYKKILVRTLKGKKNRSMFVISTTSRISDTLNHLLESDTEHIAINGIILMDKDSTGDVIRDIKVVANKDNLLDYLCRTWVDEIYVDLNINDDESVEMINRLNEMGIVVHLNLHNVIPDFNHKQFVEKIGGTTVLTNSVNYVNTLEYFFKSLIDFILGVIGCFITVILTVIIGPIIYINSPGPIFFTQTRIGKNGKRFKLYKFRSMYLDAEERKKDLESMNRSEDGMMFKMDFDPRIIGNKVLADGTKKSGIGAFIRRYSLDEFPQFFNVLKGDMSVVGTRPPTEDEWVKYKLHHRARMAIKPGITGLWQVSGRSNITDFEEVVKLDLDYITRWNLGLDILIILKTVVVMFKKDGSM